MQMDWNKAECKDTDPEWWFPGSHDPTFQQREYCNRCPMKEPCLEDALMTGDPGIRGGTSENERRRIRKRRLSA